MTDRQRAAFVLILSIAFVLIGGIGLVSTVTAASPVDTSSIDCGSALSPDDAPARTAAHEADLSLLRAGGTLAMTLNSARDNIQACTDARSGRGTWTWPLFALGVIGLLGWAFLRRPASG